ncbi:hypothetical protein [Acinetobacter phage ABPH49]|nr:hypothetical protein [Acinetobacter phage ABPH49]
MGYLIRDTSHGWYAQKGYGYTKKKENAHVFKEIPSTAFSDDEEDELLNTVEVWSSEDDKLIRVGSSHAKAVSIEMVEALEAALEWIDAVPQDTPLPTMPGFDRDWVNAVLNKAKGLL